VKFTDEELLRLLNIWMEFYPDDLNKTIFEIKKEYPKAFWKIWNEIKARKLEYSKLDQLYVGIIGTRSRDSADDWLLTHETFLKVIEGYRNDIVIVSGLCTKGGDKFAVTLYKKFKTMKLWFPAQWELFGNEAGFLRNTDIAIASDILISVRNHHHIGGAEDTVSKFIRHKKSEENLTLI